MNYIQKLENAHELIEALDKWESYAKEPRHLSIPKFRDAINLVGQIKNSFKDSPFRKSVTNQTYVYRDDKNEIQGALQVQYEDHREQYYFKIRHLLTNPQNFKEVSQNRIHGIGSNLVKKAETLADELDFASVTLRSTPSASKFYEDLGYICIDPGIFEKELFTEIH